MQEIIDLIYVQGNLLETFVRLFVLCLSIDCCFGCANCLGNLKRSLL